MGTRAALACGTALSFAVTSAWSWTADALAGPIPAPRLGTGLRADYAQLADSAAGGPGLALFATIAFIYFLCFMISGLRRIRRQAAADGAQEQMAGDRR
jgi:hypothetical protein